MYIDFLINDTDTDEQSTKNTVHQILETGSVSTITVPFYLIKLIKPIIASVSTQPTKKVDISCLVDYPMGISDLKTRQFAVGQALKSGASIIDISMPQNIAANRKYDKMREDVKNISEIAAEKNAIVRYILEYRLFDHHCLKKICEIFEQNNVKYVFPSSGFFIDNLADNIIASSFLHQNSKDINIICSGNMWTNHHFDILIKSGIFGLRINSIFALKNFLAFNYSKQIK